MQVIQHYHSHRRNEIFGLYHERCNDGDKVNVSVAPGTHMILSCSVGTTLRFLSSDPVNIRMVLVYRALIAPT